MPAITLSYFDFNGGRGEDCRLALHIAEVDFHDDRIGGPAWGARKPSTPFGSLPTLQVEGRGTLAHSNAILVWIGSTYGLHPTDPYDAARHHAVLDAVEDLRSTIGKLNSDDPDEKRTLRDAFATGGLPAWAQRIEAWIGDGPFLAGEKISVADLKLFVMVRFLQNGGLDHVPGTVLDAFPGILRLQRAVADHPRVADWVASHAG